MIQAVERLHKAPGSDQKVECEMVLRKIRPPEPPTRPPKVVVHPKGEEEPEAEPTPEPASIPGEVDYAALQKKAEKMGAALQKKMMKLMAGPGTPEEKMREGSRLSEEFQKAIKKLYGTN